MKKLFVTFSIIFLLTVLSFGQTWTYDSDFLEGPSPHGVVVDNNGLIWVGWYAYTDTLGLPNDTIPVAPIYVYNADGTQAAFSPIYTLTVSGTTDTIDTYCRGLSLDNNGDIHISGNQVLNRISHLTGEGMNKYVYSYASGSLTSAACDDNGYIYITKVVPGGGPFVILADDFTEYSVVVDSCFTIQRSVQVSPDGNDVFLPIIYAGGNEGIIHYRSPAGPDDDYAIMDTLYRGYIWGQCGDFDRNGLLWIGSYWDIGVDQYGGWYALDSTQNFQIVDTVGHNVYPDDPVGVGGYQAPRHATWSLDGQTMYTADFDGGVIKKWTNPSPAGPGSTPLNIINSVKYDGNNPIIVVDFSLDQNYPNPFNPETKIPFDIKKKFHVKLVVFDMLGRQVATLVNEELSPNHYEFTFDGTNFSSGTYFYQLIIDGAAQTKQMMLIK